MAWIALASICVAAFAGFVYLRRERLGFAGLGLALLRTAGIAALLVLLVNPGRVRRVPGGPPIVLLDASLSMGVVGGKWDAAVDTAMAIAGTSGTVLRFGAAVEPFDENPPTAGVTRLSQALRIAAAMGGPVYVVTDGEIEDASAIPPNLSDNVTFVALARDTVADAALLHVDVPSRVQYNDSVPATLTIGTWANDSGRTASVFVSIGDRRLLERDVELPAASGVARRQVTLPPRSLTSGTHALRFRLRVSGDEIGGDDERARLVTVTQQPAVVVLLDPPDWEGRFLVGELGEISRTGVQGFARVQADVWLDMQTLSRVSPESVARSVKRAELLVLRGSATETMLPGEGSPPTWRWPAVADSAARVIAADWYVGGEPQASPLAGQLAFVLWDSVPPLLGVLSSTTAGGHWVAITARQGRRGAERAVLLGRNSAAVRELITAGTGFWRWWLRGGAAREAYRAVLAAGLDWLLGSSLAQRTETLESSGVVARGEPVTFTWTRGAPPDSLEVLVHRSGTPDTSRAILRFDADGKGLCDLAPGEYEWFASAAGAARGRTVVEEYSDEFHPRALVTPSTGGAAGNVLEERYARGSFWLFALVVVAFTAEWAWRFRRGLP